MKITKFDHSCIFIEQESRGLIFDPVEYDHTLPEIDHLDAIIVTHLHGDHFQPSVIERLRAINPDIKIYTTKDNAESILGAIAVAPGDNISVGPFNLNFFGGDHAEIVPGQIPCQNLGTIVNNMLTNPGDSFAKPPKQTEMLCVPISAPWLKTSESMSYVKNLQPKVVIPIHDSLNSDLGNQIYDTWLQKACTEIDATYKSIHYGKLI